MCGKKLNDYNSVRLDCSCHRCYGQVWLNRIMGGFSIYVFLSLCSQVGWLLLYLFNLMKSFEV